MTRDERVLQELRDVIDPEVGINIVDLGLVYEATREEGRVRVRMTMTTPACPLGSYLTESVDAALRRGFPDAEAIQVELVWDPPWSPDLLTPEARRQLGWEE
jgi:metal-sulfur cluster biosynthetic enzyme